MPPTPLVAVRKYASNFEKKNLPPSKRWEAKHKTKLTDNIMDTNVKTETQVAVQETAQPKAQISFGNQGVQLASIDEAFRFAKAVVASGFAPRGMEKPESVMIAIQLGMELGLTPMAALQNTAVINGRPAIYGDAALALVRASGQLVTYTEQEVGELGKDTHGYKVTVQRKGFDSASETFTTADAKAAKLWGKAGPWTDYPRRMMKFRARGFILRDQFGDILKGLRTVEEARDMAEINVTPLADKVAGGLSEAIGGTA